MENYKKYSLSNKVKPFFDNWITGLESGEYKQAIGTLYDGNEDCYCVLGVGLKANGIDINNTNETYDILYEKTGTQHIGYDDFVRNMYRLNDNRHLNFTELAQYLKENITFE